MPTLEIQSNGRWVPVLDRPSVVEDAILRFRGKSAGSRLSVGGVEIASDGTDGTIRLSDHELLRCHIGLIEVEEDDRLIGEIDVLPGKLTTEAWRRLRMDLEQIWTGLTLDPASRARLSASGLDPRALWSRIRSVVVDLAERPVEVLSTGSRWIRHDRLRSGSQYSVAVAIAGVRGLPGRARGVASVLSEPERALVRDCLLRLEALSHRTVGADDVASAVARFLCDGVFSTPSRAAVGVTHLCRHEPRLRQVVAVRQELVHAAAVVTEGPGELRLGVKGLNRLYEYWVFLQVLRSLERRFGPPLDPGFEVLVKKMAGGRLRLELPAGCEVTFPGGVVAAFEPTLTTDPRRTWRELELVPPTATSGARNRSFVTPDIVVFHDAPPTEAIVIDAKYRARHSIDGALWEVHQKYGRLRYRGRGLVREVMVAQPHSGFELCWAGQRAVPAVPGGDLGIDLWPDAWRGAEATARADSEQCRSEPDSLDEQDNGVAAGPVGVVDGPAPELVVCDQEWMALAIGRRRLDMSALKRVFGSGQPCHLVGSASGPRAAFQHAAQLRGWRVSVAESRAEVITEVRRIVLERSPKVSMLMTDDPRLLAEVESRCEAVVVIDDVTEFIRRGLLA